MIIVLSLYYDGLPGGRGDGGAGLSLLLAGHSPTWAKVQKNIFRTKLGDTWEVAGRYLGLTDFFLTNTPKRGVVSLVIFSNV
jgi:hypothetical protein